MPIRLPNLPRVQSAPNLANASLSIAAAPGQALARTGQAIASAAPAFANIAHEIQNVENKAKESKYRQALAHGFSELQLSLAKEDDPATHLEKYEQYMQSQAGLADKMQLAPTSRDSMGLYFSEFTARGRIRVAEGAAQMTIRNAKATFNNEAQAARQNLDPVAFDNAMSDAQGAGLITSIEAEGLRENFNNDIDTQKINEAILDDPAGFLEISKDESYRKKHAHIDKEGWRRLENEAKKLQAQERRELGAELLDMIYDGTLKTPEKIDELGSELRPTSLARIKSAMDDYQAKQVDGMSVAPVDQMYLSGRIMASLSNYTPDKDGIDEDYVEIDSMVRQIESPALKAEYTRKLKAVREGEDLKEVKTITDAADQQIMKLYNAGEFGKVDEIKTVKRDIFSYLEDGFFDDGVKLKSLGFSDKQAKKIYTAKDKDQKVTRQAQANMVKQLWLERENESTADDFTQELGDALARGKSLTSVIREYEDPQSKLEVGRQIEKRDRNLGRIKTEFSEWSALNANATNEQAAEKLHEIGVNVQAESLNVDIEEGAFGGGAMIDTAKGYLGLREFERGKSNPEIAEMVGDITPSMASDKTPWCSAFVNRVAALSGLKGSGSLAARSWLKVGEEVPTEQAREGDVVVFWRESPDSWKGHVGIYAGTDGGGNIRVIGGNQGDSVSTKSYPISRLLSVRRLQRVGN